MARMMNLPVMHTAVSSSHVHSCCSVLHSCGAGGLSQVMRSPKLDHLHAVSLLVSLPHNQAWQLLVASRKLCKGYSKMMVRERRRGRCAYIQGVVLHTVVYESMAEGNEHKGVIVIV